MRRAARGSLSRAHGDCTSQAKTGGTLNVDLSTDIDFTDPALDGRTIQDSNNSNTAYFNDPKFNLEAHRLLLVQPDLHGGPGRPLHQVIRSTPA
jgi:hypothetical protein